MKKVFIIHGFEGTPNGGWKSWLMRELDRLDVYACALPMPTPKEPKCDEWVEEISRNIPEVNKDIFLIGHSLGCVAILNYLETLNTDKKLGGIFLVAGPSEKLEIENPNSVIRKIDNFFNQPFLFEKIKNTAEHFVIIHGDNDENVPLWHAEKIAKKLDGELVVVKNGGHLSGWNGFNELPELLESFKKMMK